MVECLLKLCVKTYHITQAQRNTFATVGAQTQVHTGLHKQHHYHQLCRDRQKDVYGHSESKDGFLANWTVCACMCVQVFMRAKERQKETYEQN